MSESESAQQMRAGGQPVFILSEDSERTSGRDAQQANISAGKAIAETVRTTLGPQGMDKMLVSDSGDVVISNDGATILDEMDIDHPAAQMLVDVADEQEEALGDGTTTAAILTGELLSTAEEFLDQDLHPRTVVEGYRRAEAIALEALDDAVLDREVDGELLRTVVATSMTGKGVGSIPVETLAETVVEAVRRVEVDGAVDRDAVAVTTRVGRSANATEVVDGVVTDAEPVHTEMARSVADATVAVVDSALEQREADVDVEYTIDSADQLSDAISAEEETLRGYAEALADAGVDAVFATDDIADGTADHLARAGIVAFENLDSDDANAITDATGAALLPRVEDVEADDLGTAEAIGVETVDEETVTRIEGGSGTQRATLLVRGGTEHALDEIERAVTDGIDAAVAAYSDPEVVPGGGTAELAMADRLREEAAGIEGRAQLAVEAVADALDAVPRTLAQNAGLDPIDTLVDLRAANQDGRAGLVANGETRVADPVEHGVIDPAAVKRESVRSAVEVATMIIRIDDVISAD